MIGPVVYLIRSLDVLLLDTLEHLVDVVLGRGYILDTDNTLENDVGLAVAVREHHTGTVDQVDALHERNVLPDLGLAGDRGHFAHLLLAKGVDHRALARVRVADEAHADLLVLLVQVGELTQ